MVVCYIAILPSASSLHAVVADVLLLLIDNGWSLDGVMVASNTKTDRLAERRKRTKGLRGPVNVSFDTLRGAI